MLCSDKTGTLTMNRLTVQDAIPYRRIQDRDDVLLCAALATQRSSEDAIDLAVMAALPAHDALDGFKQKAFTPFDPVSKRTIATVADGAGGTRHYAKGAPQAISALVRPDAQTLQNYHRRTWRRSPPRVSARSASRGRKTAPNGRSSD